MFCRAWGSDRVRARRCAYRGYGGSIQNNVVTTTNSGEVRPFLAYSNPATRMRLTETEMPAARFPRPVFDESGAYSIKQAGAYEATAPSIERYYEVAFATRDLRSAHEMVAQCCRDDLDSLHPLLEQSLWISAVILYSKPFKRNNARARFDAAGFIRLHSTEEARDIHHYLITLRDKMIAHDDALGECKQISIWLPNKQPTHRLEIGIEPINPRVVSLGWDIAREMEPHFRATLKLLEDYRHQLSEKTTTDLIRSKFSEVSLIGPARKTSLRVDPRSVTARWPRDKT
jgi:hypothetical protein